jgi:tetratricopeptide (TPR) repeat protein
MKNRMGVLGALSLILFWGGIIVAIYSFILDYEYDVEAGEYVSFEENIKGIFLVWVVALLFYIIDKIKHNKENQLLKIPVEQQISAIHNDLKSSGLVDTNKIFTYLDRVGINKKKILSDDLIERLPSISYSFPLNIAEYMYGKSLFSEAILITSSCIQSNSEDQITCYLIRGKSYFRIKKYYESIADCTIVIESNSTFGAAYFYRALSNFGVRRIESAYADYDEACKYGEYPEGGLETIFSGTP